MSLMMRVAALAAFGLMPAAAGFCDTAQQGQRISAAAAALAAPEVSALNRAFILTPGDVANAIAKGRKFASDGKSFLDLVNADAHNPRGVKGEKGTSHQSIVLCYGLDGVGLQILAFNAANHYDPVDIPASVMSGGTYVHTLTFYVVLHSIVKVDYGFWYTVHEPSPADVQVEKFVLTDDKGDMIVGNGSWSDSAPSEPDTSEASGMPGLGVGQGAAGPEAAVAAFGYGDQAASYPWFSYSPLSPGQPYYSATYRVSFAQFGPDGKPLIKKDAHKMTLHMVKPNGELAVDFDLNPPNP